MRVFVFDIGRRDLLGAGHGSGCAAQNVLDRVVMKNSGDRREVSLFCAKPDSKNCCERCEGGNTGALVGFEGTDFGHL